MPRIKAYKNGTSKRQLIPVDAAKICTAYQCPWTTQIFGDKRQYVRHLKDLRESRMHRRARAAKFEKVRSEFNNQKTFEDVIRWIENHPEFFFDAATRNSFSIRNIRPSDRENFFIKITYLKLTWSAHVSNSHNCPRGGTTNWGRRNMAAPTGYPGWEGRIGFTLCQYNSDGTLRHCPLSGSDIFRNTGIETGSGGGGDTYEYSVIFFDADWPGVTRTREKEDVLAAMDPSRKGNYRFSYDGRARITIAG